MDQVMFHAKYACSGIAWGVTIKLRRVYPQSSPFSAAYDE